MIESIMYVAIGFLLAGLLVIGFIPLVHARAVRLTMKRLEAATPMSMAEIQADKDQLRAEYAMATRRLEMSVEEMKAKTIGQLAEIGKKGEAIGRLKLELGEKTAALFALEAKEPQLREELQQTRQELAARTATLEETQRALAARGAEFATIHANFNTLTLASDSERVELMALRAQVEVLKGQLESYQQETGDLHERIMQLTSDSEATTQQVIEERGTNESLGNRIGELERQIVVHATEAEIVSRRVAELMAKIEEQGRSLAERERTIEELRAAAAVAQQTEADLSGKLADTANRLRATTESLGAEKAAVEEELRQANEERARLQRDIETVKREAEAAWAAERMENAVTRERINDVAAEVARLTSLLEGPGSPIEAILAGDSGRPQVPINGNGHDSADGHKSTLADRMRALQSRAHRVPEAGQA